MAMNSRSLISFCAIAIYRRLSECVTMGIDVYEMCAADFDIFKFEVIECAGLCDNESVVGIVAQICKRK